MFTDLSRPPLTDAGLRRGSPLGRPWGPIRVLATTGSTHADVVAAARSGAPEGLVVVADHQTAGRGRRGREWTSPPRAGLAVSVLLRPGAVPSARRGWLPLLAGVVLAEVVARVAGVPTRLKWPNDLLVGSGGADSEDAPAPAKAAGVLAELVESTAGPAIVLGIGLNVTNRRDELPPRATDAPPITSLALAGAAVTDRATLLRELLRRLGPGYLAWRDVDGDPAASGLRPAYAAVCDTLGRPVRVILPGDRQLVGRATDIDIDGRLVVDGPDGPVAVAAGEVVHLR